jgi:hypothetical protein
LLMSLSISALTIAESICRLISADLSNF